MFINAHNSHKFGKRFPVRGLCLLLGSLTALFLQSCNNTPAGSDGDSPALLSIGDSKLYQTDLMHMIPMGMPIKDSGLVRQRLIEKWATEELFYQQALENLNDEEKNVEKDVEQYRKDLVSYRFEIKLINQQLDTNVSAQEIETYYNQNPQDFLLKNNIVKAVYAKTPKTIPGLDKFKKLCLSTNPKDSSQFKSMCIQYATNYFIDNSTWLLVENIKQEVPQLREIPDYNLTDGKVFEFTDSLSYYFIRIKEIRTKNSLSPLNFEKANIKSLIINQRKQFLVLKYKKDLLEQAKANKTIPN